MDANTAMSERKDRLTQLVAKLTEQMDDIRDNPQMFIERELYRISVLIDRAEKTLEELN